MSPIDESANFPAVAPPYTDNLETEPIPKLRMPDSETEPDSTYRFIRDELLFDGSSKLNLATFVSTWMDPQARLLMAQTFDKNMIDKDEYPATAEIESRCVNMVADLFHAEGLSEDDPDSATGVSTVGSSEAVMLGGLALKWRWRAARQAAGKDASRPNLILGTNVQVVWEKFCRYFDVEPKYLPVEKGRYLITPEQVRDAVDENTIGVVAILGTTFTGEFEPVSEISRALDEVASAGGPDVPLHIDAASGGFVAPFIHPDLEWDFRIPRVVSINVSGHKYGMTYPGIGFIVWRSAEHLPEDLVFRVNYLGGDMPTFTLNFSRPGNQVLAQYYNFVRLGKDGYTKVMQSLQKSANMFAQAVSETNHLKVISDGSAIPVVSFEVEGDPGFDVFEISHELRSSGLQVPAYTMPANAEEVAVLRAVFKEGFSGDMAWKLGTHLQTVVANLEKGRSAKPGTGFAHL